MDSLAEMQEIKISADNIAYNSAISACAKAGIWEHAFSLLEELHLQKLLADLVTFCALTSACEKGQQWEIALNLVQQVMPRSKGGGVSPSIVTYSALVSALGRGGEWIKATEICNEVMAMASKMKPNEVFCGAMINAYAVSNEWSKGLQFLFEMPEMKVKRNEVTYNAAIAGLEGQAHWQLAVSVLQHMSLEMKPSKISYHALVRVCNQAHAWQNALCILEHISLKFDDENAVASRDTSWAARISAYNQGSQWQAAIHLAFQLAGSFQTALPKSYATALAACGSQGRWHLVMALFEYILKTTADAVDSSHLQAAINFSQSWEWSIWLLDKAQENAFELSHATFNSALSTFRRSSQWTMALAALKNYPRLLPTLDVTNLQTVLFTMGETSQWQQVQQILAMPMAQNVP